MSLSARVLRTRALVRAPIPLFRARMGFLLGPRMLLLEHVGRQSGQTRRVVLEVVERTDRDQLVIASGFGVAAQWYRNLQANSHCWVSTGTRYHRPAVAHNLTADEAAVVLERYRRAHPTAYRALAGAISELNDLPIESVPLVRLTLR